MEQVTKNGIRRIVFGRRHGADRIHEGIKKEAERKGLCKINKQERPF